MIESILPFFSEHGYVYELLISNLIFTFSQQKRRYFPLRVLLAALLLTLSSLLLNQVQVESVSYNIFKYLVWFFISVVFSALSCEMPFSIALFTAIGAFVCQHMAFKTGEVALYFVGNSLGQSAKALLYVAVIAAVFVFSFFAFARRIKQLDKRYMAQSQLIFLCVAVAIYTTILQYLFTNYLGEISSTLYLIYASFDIICCMFAMTLQYGIFKANTLEEEKNRMEHVLFMQKKEFMMSKENMELINVKFHDLKNQLSSLRGLDEGELRTLYKTLNIYDMSIQSGSEVLDIVLAEKSRLCQKHGIRLECMANGSLLSFMSPSDVYALFSNALDNAIDSVLKVSDSGRRFINLSVKLTRGLLIIHVENPFEDELSFVDGLPQTTKEDKNIHGFGMKSIRLVVEKYSGFLSIQTDDQLFCLNISFI